MTAVEDDFTGYVGARWPSLVRTLVLLGCPIDLAPDVVTDGLARCRRGWRDTAERDDLEVVVHRAVLEAWDERRRESWWTGLRPRHDDDWPLPDLAELDRLVPEVRAGLVLRRYSSLDVAQAAAIAGPDAGGPLPHAPDAPTLLAAAESVVAYAPPSDADLMDHVAARRRRRRLLPLLGLVAAGLLLGGGTWWANRDSSEGGDGAALEAVEPQRGPNSAEVAWFAGEVLHLQTASYRIPGLKEFAVLGAGAVYSDADSEVVLLADDGTRTRIGAKDPSASLVVSQERGQVAWVTQGEDQVLQVYDVAQGRVVDELDLPPTETGPTDVPDTRPVAFDSEQLYYMTSRGWGAWTPGEAEAEGVQAGDLSDASSRNLMFQLDEQTISLVQPFFNVQYDVPGRGGQLSEDGNYALTRNPDDGTVMVYDTRSGEQVDVSPPLDVESVIAATMSPDLSVTYLAVDPDAFAQQEGSDSNPTEGQIVSCRVDRLSLGECTEPVTFVVQSDAPLLAQ